MLGIIRPKTRTKASSQIPCRTGIRSKEPCCMNHSSGIRRCKIPCSWEKMAHCSSYLCASHGFRNDGRSLGIHKENTPYGYRLRKNPQQHPSGTQQSMKPTFSFSWFFEVGSLDVRCRKLTVDPHVLCVD